MRYFYGRLANKKGRPGPTSVCTTQGQAEVFLETHDKPGHGIYWCPNPLKEDGDNSRTIENVGAIEVIWFDIDLRQLTETKDEIETKLLGLALEPTEVNETGGGWHLIYRLKEPILAEDEDEFAFACELWKSIARRLSADPAPTHPAAFMRCPGSHNTKYGESREVVRVWGSGREVDITELEQLEDLLPDDGLFERKVEENGADMASSSSYNGTGESVDIDQRLADMCFEGSGDNCVHHTQVSVTAAMLRAGVSVDETVATVLEATRRVAPAAWDWSLEEHELERMCFAWISKHPDLAYTLPDDLLQDFEAARAEGTTPLVKWDRLTGCWHVHRRKTKTATNGSAGGPERQSRPNWSTGPGLIMRCAADIEPEPLDWIWQNRISRGKHTALAGEPGLGKSQAGLSIVATITKGGAWPNNEGLAPLGKVIILSAEDGAADTIVPRLIAAGADRSLVHLVHAVEGENGKGQRTFNLQNDLALLEAKISELGEVQLILMDPISAYFGKGVDSHKDTEVRTVLAPISEMAERLHVAILTISHFNKSSGPSTTKAMHKFMGSIAFVAAPRVAFIIVEDPEDPERRLFLHGKNNLSPPAPGLSFHIKSVLLPITDISTSCVAWDAGTIDMTADEAVAAGHAKETAPALEEAKQFLTTIVGPGGMNAKEIETEAKAAGLSWATVRRAKDELGFKSIRPDFTAGWLWKR